MTLAVGLGVLAAEPAFWPIRTALDCGVALYEAKGAGRNRVSVAIAA
ncbi:MAG TPA: hypothetical protein VGT07_12320 [Steroidobacteraceae bacterium]|nr:hypothetical protein [Steroidobacteraceae bacterium]